MKLVLDTDVLVAAFRSPTGASRQLLLTGLNQRLTLVISPPLLLQYEEVLKRDEHLQAAAALRADVDQLLDQVAATAELANIHYLWRPRLSDVGDEMVLEAAVNGRVDVLVTFNLKDFITGASQFDLELLRPGDAWRRFLQETHNAQ